MRRRHPNSTLFPYTTLFRSCPFLIAAPPGDACKNETKRKMFGPIAKQADVAHEIAHRAALMLRDEITHGVVEVKCRCDRYRCDDDADQPIKNGGAPHK